MRDTHEIRFLTGNLFQLQGLRLLPFGAAAVLTVIWTSLRVNPKETSYIFLGCLALATSLAYWIIDRYYARHFGQVKAARRLKQQEIVLMVLGGILGLAGLWVDFILRPPISVLGLVMVFGMVCEYLRVNWRDNWRELWAYLLVAALLLLFDLLPLVIGPAFWKVIGIQSRILGLLLVTGLGMIALGIWSHFYLIHVLPPRKGS